MVCVDIRVLVLSIKLFFNARLFNVLLVSACVCAYLVASEAYAQATFADDQLIYDGAAASVQWGDFDEDGLEDMFIAEGGKHSRGNSVLSWFKAPNWTEYAIGPDLTTFTGDSDVVDIDGDGHLDIVVPRDDHSDLNPPGSMQWYRNPGNLAATPNQAWTKYTIEANVPDAFHQGDLETSDVDGDGKLDIVVRSLGVNRFVIYFQNNARSSAANAWTKVRINSPHPREGLVLGDLDGNSRTDIIGNGFILFAPNNPRACTDANPSDGIDRCMASWLTKTFDANYFNANQSGLNNSTKGEVFDMDGDGRLDILQSSAEGNAVYLAWYKNPSNARTGNWARNLIESPQQRNHNVQVADVDLDGDADVLGGFSFGSRKVYWWENINGLATAWTRHEIEGTHGCYSCVASDFDNDGDVDFAGPSRYVGNVYLYENTTADGSTALSLSPQSMQFASAGGNQTLVITSDVAWTATSNQAWLTISSTSADSSASISVTATARSASEFGTRNGVVTVSNGTISRNLSVAQAGAADVDAPSVPSAVVASDVSFDFANLSWSGSSDNSGVVTEYVIYLNGSEFKRTPDTSSALTGLTESTVYSIWVSAVDPSGNESELSTAIVATTTARPPSPPPFAHWRLDESSGISANDSAVTANDGALVGGMAGDQWDGVNNLLGASALRFDGAAERIDLNNMDAPTSALTIIGWIRPSNIQSNNGEGRIISKASGSSAQQHYWMLSTDENGSSIVPRVRLKTAGNTSTLLASSSAQVNNGVWSQIIATYNGSLITLYHNGVNVGEMAATGAIDQNNSVDAVIGNQPAGDRGFEGLIDEVCIFDYSITQQDVNYLYNNGLGRTCETLVSGSNPDITAPVLVEVTSVRTPTTETSPGYTYNTSEAGQVVYGGACFETPGSDVAAGDVSIAFEELAPETYNDCTVIVTDAAGNASNTLIVTAFTIIVPDTTKPRVEVNQAADQADPTTSNIARFVATFSEPINRSTFAASDISLSGTSGRITVGPTALSGNRFVFSVTGMASDDTVVASIAAGRVEDLAANTNQASTQTDNQVTYVCDGCEIDDDDNDGVANDQDNCPLDDNPDQADSNANGIGNVCENDEICFPIKASNGAVAMICL